MTPKRLPIHICQAEISHKSTINTYTHTRHQESVSTKSDIKTRIFANYNSHIRHFNAIYHNTIQEHL